MTATTEPTDADILTLSDELWSSVLGVTIVPTEAAHHLAHISTTTAWVNIQGAWDGTVSLECPSTLARRITALMFAMEPEECTDDEIRDALGEMANITGGGVKGLVPGPSQLSLPTVVEGIDYSVATPGAELVREVSFRCDDEDAVVRVLRRSSPIAG